MKFRDYTMIPQGTYCENLILMDKVEGLPGVIVECGTWKGGMIAGIVAILGDEKEYLLFDSFEGLPPAKEIDVLGQSNGRLTRILLDITIIVQLLKNQPIEP